MNDVASIFLQPAPYGPGCHHRFYRSDGGMSNAMDGVENPSSPVSGDDGSRMSGGHVTEGRRASRSETYIFQYQVGDNSIVGGHFLILLLGLLQGLVIHAQFQSVYSGT